MAAKNLYRQLYQKFLDARAAYQGYDFQHSPSGSVAPPQASFTQALKWWTINRPSRMKKIRDVRDQQQEDIVALKHPPSPSS